MNKKMLARLLWQQCVIRPHVLSIFAPHWSSNRPQLLVQDWPWLVTNCGRRTLHMQDTTTGNAFALTTDHIVEFRESLPGRPSFLMLKSQVFMTALEVWPEPINNHRPHAPLDVQMLFPH